MVQSHPVLPNYNLLDMNNLNDISIGEFIKGGNKMFSYLLWIFKGRKYIEYNGYHCGCCGKWTEEKLRVPKYKSGGKWWDTWGFCDNCRKDVY